MEVPGTAQTLVVSASSDGYVRVWDLTASVRDGRAHPALIAFHADVRLTCVRAYVPDAASTSKPKASQKKRADKPTPAPGPGPGPASAAGKPPRPAKPSAPVPTAPKASASPAAKHAPAKPVRPASNSNNGSSRRKQPAV